ncbi:hypothetical protein HK405_000195, partial [Cladochytrium tenue]
MFGRPLLKTGEPPHVRARRDAEIARLEYIAAIESSEHTRAALEFHITDFLASAQEAEAYRLSVAGEALLALESAQLFAVAELSAAWSTGTGLAARARYAADGLPVTMLPCPVPGAGVQHIARRFRTGHLRTPPFVFESAAGARAPLQVFGIGLEELARASRRPVPTVVAKCIGVLLESLDQGRSSVDTWIAPINDLPGVQFLRHELNGGGAAPSALKTFTLTAGGGGGSARAAAAAGSAGRTIRSATLRRYSPAVVAGVLRQFFLEAPVSLVSHELYEPLKILYSEAPIILRPRYETRETVADEEPWRFTRDLITNYPRLIGGSRKTESAADDVRDLVRRAAPSPVPGEDEDEANANVGFDDDEML